MALRGDALGGRPEVTAVTSEVLTKESFQARLDKLQRQVDELKRLLSANEGKEVLVEGLVAAVESLAADIDIYTLEELDTAIELVELMVQWALKTAESIKQAQALANALPQEDPHRAELLSSAEKTQQALVACAREEDDRARLDLWNHGVVPSVEGMNGALMPIKADLLSREIKHCAVTDSAYDKHIYAQLLHKITSGGFSDEVRHKLIRELDEKFPQYAHHNLEGLKQQKNEEGHSSSGYEGESRDALPQVERSSWALIEMLINAFPDGDLRRVSVASRDRLLANLKNAEKAGSDEARDYFMREAARALGDLRAVVGDWIDKVGDGNKQLAARSMMEELTLVVDRAYG